MLIKDVSRGDLEYALRLTNEQFDNNIIFKRIDVTNSKNTHWNVTLTVKSSKGKGSRISHNGRRIAAACWHAHGTFMDNLPTHARIVTSSVGGRVTVKPGDEWQDRNIGSVYYPFYYSEACECER